MSDKLTGLRVLVQRGGGLVYGVARVRYNEGHAYGGSYEIERADGTSFLATYGECMVGANWDVTPEEGRFTGAQFFRPNFLDGATAQDSHLFRRSDGVTVPSDLPRLLKAVSVIEPGQTVKWYSHGCNEFRGPLTVDSVDAKGITLKGGKGHHPTRCTWPVTGGPEIGPQYAYEFTTEERAVHFHHVPPKRYGSSVSKSLTIEF